MKPHFVKDPAGWLCFSVLVGIWLYNSMVIPKLVLLPHYNEGHLPGAVLVAYFIASALCVAALLRASTADPGHPPVDPHIPPSEQQHWTLCRKCEAMRPKRSHHCRRCGHCVRRMDHHCPWINNCVGEDNHWLFLQLCLYALVLSLLTLLLVFCHSFYFQPLATPDQETFTGRHEVGLLRASGVMSVFMLAGISVLSCIQMSGILSEVLGQAEVFDAHVGAIARVWSNVPLVHNTRN
ncbi:palmitoyltransferase ZDHHC21-like [Aulostomus maculatus]